MPGIARPPLTSDRGALEALQRVTDAALAHLSEQELLDELLLRLTEILHTDTAAILLLDEAGDLLRARAARGIEEEVEQRVTIPVGKGFAGRVVADRTAVIIDDVDRADIYNPILREKGIRSLLGVPLLLSGRALGVLHVGSLTPRTFTEEERDLLQLAADRAALAIEHARVYEQERRARETLESLQRITDAALAYLPQDELLHEILARITSILRVDTSAILLLDGSGEFLTVRAALGLEESLERGLRIPVGSGFAGRVATAGRAVVIDDVAQADVVNPVLREKGVASLLGVPLLIEGRVLGVLHVGTLSPRAFTTAEEDLLQLAADRAALAIENALLFEQRRVAEALQRQLLPKDLGAMPGLELASRYLPASGESLGGDWYDSFALAGGRIVVMVGDVVGHGLPAAAVMAQLRTAVRAYAADGHEPHAVVERVNRLMWELGPTAMTTVAYVVIDPESETLELVNAGHPPPLVVGPDGTAAFLPLQGGAALGINPLARHSGTTHAFPTGATVMLYTDGLVERRGEVLDVGLERLRSAAEAIGAGRLDDLCGGVAHRLVPDERPDDVAIIAVRVPRPEERLSGSWPADREALAGIRRLLRRWLRDRGATHDEVYDITVACQEACANAVEHAYRPGHQSFTIDAEYADGLVRITVGDRGRWREPRGSNRGRGLPLMRALMDTVDVRQGDEGTVVVLERRLGAG